MTLTEFAQLVIEEKNMSYTSEKTYVFGEMRKKFNELIKYSAKYIQGRKVIDHNKVSHLKLAFRKNPDGYVSYSVAFARFVEKCRQEKYAKQWGLETLTYSHNTYV